MLGRVRASPTSSLELLEMERSSSKISKQDSLSIYESTLLKLKQGSQCCQRSTSEGSATTYTHSTIATHPPEEVMSYADCSSAESSPNPSGISRSAHSSNEKQSTNMYILYMFSNYKISKHAVHTNDMDIELLFFFIVRFFTYVQQFLVIFINSSIQSSHQATMVPPEPEWCISSTKCMGTTLVVLDCCIM